MEMQDVINVLVQQNGHFKDMLFWSVGGIITILILFVGSNYFNMRSFRQEEIKKVKSEIQLSLQNDFISGLKDEIKEEMFRELQLKVDDLTSTYNENFTKIENASKNIDRKFNSVNSNIDDKYKSINRELTRTKIDLKELEADLWYSEGVYSNALRTYAESAIDTMDNGFGNLEFIIVKVEKTLGKMSGMRTFDVPLLHEFVEKLPSEFNVSKKAIQEKLELIIKMK